MKTQNVTLRVVVWNPEVASSGGLMWLINVQPWRIVCHRTA